MSSSPWRRWSADEIYNRENEEQNTGGEEHLMFSFSPSSSQRFLTPITSNTSNVDDEVFENEVTATLYLFFDMEGHTD